MPFVYTFGMTSNDHVIYKWHEPRGLPVFSFSLLRVRVYRQDFHFHYEGLGFNSARSLKQSRAKRHDGSRRLETGEKKKKTNERKRCTRKVSFFANQFDARDGFPYAGRFVAKRRFYMNSLVAIKSALLLYED